jgi:hypothetical protein
MITYKVEDMACPCHQVSVTQLDLCHFMHIADPENNIDDLGKHPCASLDLHFPSIMMSKMSGTLVPPAYIYKESPSKMCPF